jgi:spore maturation protein CgeB
MNRRLIVAVSTFQPDVIVILKGETISREALVALRAQKIPLASWWVDDPFHYPMFLRNFELFDMVYVFDKESVAKLGALGIRHVMYLPCACDQTTFYPQTLDPSDYPDLNCTIGFIATHYPGRAELLSQLKGLDIGLWGGGWWEAAHELCELPDGYWRGHRITPADAARVYNLARICPNVHHPQTRLGGLNTRTFEIPAAGGFELVDNIPGLEEHFDIGREIVAYSSSANFRELTEYYLSHPAEREAIVGRGRARVLREHTYEKRLETILKTLDLFREKVIA